MSSNPNELDISNIPSENVEELARKIEDYYKGDASIKSALSYNWDRNHLFLDGKQWIVFDGDRGAYGQWRPLSVSRTNEYIPRPVTNYIFDAYQTLKSYLVQHRPQSKVYPNTQTYRDKQAAKIGSLCLNVNWEKLKEDYNYEFAASAVITYGTVFKKDYWDLTSVSTVKVPRTEQKPIMDPLSGSVLGFDEVEVVDPATGETIYDELPLGDINTYIVEPHRMIIDVLATDVHNCRYIGEYSIQTLDWIQEQYGREGDGYTGKVDEVKEEETLSTSMRRYFEMKNSSGVKFGIGAANVAGASYGSNSMIPNAAVVKEIYERPSRTHPKGRLIVVANGVTLYVGDSPYSGPELGDWHPYSECRWEVLPGRFWGKGPLDEATEVQKHINSIDSVLILTRKTMAIPQKLIPDNSGITPGTWTGRPGQEVRFRSSGATPTTIPAVGVDDQVFRERAQKVDDIKALTGATDILKGDRPPGVTAASALEMLYEVATGKLKPVLDRWKKFIETSQKKQLRLIAQKYREPRKAYIAMLHAKNKEIPPQDLDNFIGSDLYDNSNVVIEAGSNIPKLQSAEKALLLQLAQIGTLDLQDPENKAEFNRKMGINSFDNKYGPDIKRAEWENDILENVVLSGQNQAFVLADENHQAHIEIHMRRVKDPSFGSMDSQVQDAYMQHIQQHQQYIDMQQQQAMELAVMTGKPPEAPAPNEANIDSAGKGISQKMQDKTILADVPKGPR